MSLMRRSLVVAAAATITATFLSGCFSAFYWGESSPPLDEETVAGTWIADGPDGENAVIELRPDGTASIEGMPYEEAFQGNGTLFDWTRPWSGEAEWEIRLQEDGHVWSVTVFGEVALGLVSIRAEDDDCLVVFAGDPDERVRLYFRQTARVHSPSDLSRVSPTQVSGNSGRA